MVVLGWGKKIVYILEKTILVNLNWLLHFYQKILIINVAYCHKLI
jgi:hypothetical protein